MPLSDPAVRHARAVTASRTRWATPGTVDPELESARRRLRILKLADQIHDAVTAWPPLTDDEKADLVRLFGTGRRGGASG